MSDQPNLATDATFGPGNSSGETSAPAKKTWHAPKFMLTEIAATDLQNSLTTDGSAAQS